MPVVNATTGTLSVLASSPPSDEATLMSGEGKSDEVTHPLITHLLIIHPRTIHLLTLPQHSS